MVKYRVTHNVMYSAMVSWVGLGLGLKFQIRSSVKKVVRLKL